MLTHVDNRITYSGNGNATEFAYQFKILDRTAIKVLLTDADGKEKLLTKDYYVDVEKSVVRYPGYAVGAEVPESERPAVLPAGWKLTIYREVPVTQETDLPDQYPFNQVEAIGDKLTMIAQQLTDTTGRSLKIGVSKSTDIDTTIPWENGKSFRISNDGKTLELSEDPAKVLPLAQGVYTQTQAQAQSAAASATAAAKSENSAAASASEAGNSAQSASVSAASAAESAELTSGYKQEALAAKADAAASATNAEASKEAAQSAASNANNFATSASSSASEAKSYRDAANNYAANAKNYSENVNVFLPSVSDSGVLSWTNKAGLANPASVNIKGAKGDKGTAATIKVGTVTTGPAGSAASVVNRGDANNAILDFVLPKGADGKGSVITVNGKEPDADGNVNVANMEGATSNVAGKAGLVPIPATGKQDMALCGDATFKVLPIAGGGTGATDALSALLNLGIAGVLMDVSVDGQKVTFTKKDGSTVSINTQDTNNGIVAALLGQNGYAKFKNGLILQWGNAKSSSENVILPIPFANETWKIAGMRTTKSYDYTPTVVSKTNRSFDPGAWGLPYDYIAIGF